MINDDGASIVVINDDGAFDGEGVGSRHLINKLEIIWLPTLSTPIVTGCGSVGNVVIGLTNQWLNYH